MQKPLRYAPLKSVEDLFAPIPCARCGDDTKKDPLSVTRYEDTDMGGYIERRVLESFCGKCLDAG